MVRTQSHKVVFAIILKDLQTEFRSRELISSMVLFALLSILVFSFALELDRAARAEAISGVLWVTVVFASILGLNRSLSMERDQGNFDAMLIAPVSRTAIFLGKLVGNFLFALIVGLLLIPLMTVLYNITLVNGWLLLVLLLGTLGFSTIGTLLATMTVQTKSRETLLPIVMLPLALPVILAVVKASTGILNNAPADDWTAWLQILAAVNVVYFVVCFFMFDYIIEE